MLDAYRLALPRNIRAHNVFQVSLLEKCLHNPNHMLDWTMIQVELDGELQINFKPLCILNKKMTVL